jgi:sugar transferase (PEP-CTERM system associated)
MIRFFNHYISIGVLAVLVGDLAFAALAMGGLVLLSGPFPALSPPHPFATGIVWSLSMAFLFFQGGLYDAASFEVDRRNVIRLLSAFVLLGGLGVLVLKAVPAVRLGWRGELALTGLTLALVAFWRWVLVLRLPIHEWKRSTLILGTGQISRIFEELNRYRHNIRIQAVVDAQRIKEMDLARYAMENKIHSIVISLKDRRGTLPIHEILECKMNGIEVMEWPTFYEKNMNKIDIMNVNPSHLVLGDGFQRNRVTVVIKGVMDRVLALLGIVAFAPIGAVIALAIRLNSPGPVFYSQERVGLNGKTFRILKFRSMVTDAEKNRAPQWASEQDPRITKVGRFLRKTRLDEVPQLINILKGEMSFIGPRPERPYFVEELEKCIPFYGLRHVTKPGLSGWAQIRYRYGATVEDAVKKLEYDLYYIKNLSIFLDLMIFMETIQVILFGKGSR